MPGGDLLAENDVIKCQIHGVAGSSVWENVLHYRLNSIDTPFGDTIIDQLNGIAGVFDDLFFDVYKTILCDTVKITGLKVKRVSGDGSPVYQAGYNIAGTLPQMQAATASAACIRKFTATAGKSGIGMFYIPALSESLQTGDFVDVGSALFTAMHVLITATLEMPEGYHFVPCLFTEGGEDGNARDVLAAQTNSIVSTQDRRRPRV